MIAKLMKDQGFVSEVFPNILKDSEETKHLKVEVERSM
jgi:hypothetical protein